MSSSTEKTTLHGVFLDIYDSGVLLTGPSGIGKSEVALSLIKHGHRLIADDSVEFHKKQDDVIIGSCHPILQDFLEVRGLGPLNIKALFGASAIKKSQKLHLIIEIKQLSHEEIISIDRLYGMHTEQMILGLSIPQVTIPLSPGRNLGVLVEAAVRNQHLKKEGYHASEHLAKRQMRYMRKQRGKE